MGSVWKAEHLILCSEVAVKIIDPEFARLEFNLARFLREARTLATLQNPHVVQVLDYGFDADTAYLVMELLDGETLGSRLDAEGRLSLSETTRVVRDVCTAMSMVHAQGLIHRDLKPDNIFLCAHERQIVAKVVDFGIAKSLRPELSTGMQTRTGHVLGTPGYMSPEQCRGLKDIDQRTDVWSLGVIAYQCLVGKEPFEGEALGDVLLRICMDPIPVPSEHSVVPLPIGFDGWFAKAVARDRAARFQSVAELAAALTRLSTINGLGVVEVPPLTLRRVESGAGAEASAPLGSPESSRARSDTETNTSVGLRTISRRRFEPMLKLGAAALLTLGFGLGWWLLGEAPPPEDVNAKIESLRPAEASAQRAPASRVRRVVPSGRRWYASPAALEPLVPPPAISHRARTAPVKLSAPPPRSREEPSTTPPPAPRAYHYGAPGAEIRRSR